MNFSDYVEQTGKPWKAKKEEILGLWNSLRPYMPVNPQPVPAHHVGTRYDNDGIRITGTAAFIDSVLSRFKDLIPLDSRPGVQLDLEYRQVETKYGTPQDRQVFVCYIHLVQKEDKKNATVV